MKKYTVNEAILYEFEDINGNIFKTKVKKKKWNSFLNLFASIVIQICEKRVKKQVKSFTKLNLFPSKEIANLNVVSNWVKS